MRKNVILKSTLRQAFRGALLMFLLALATFFLVSRVAEYQIVTAEVERIRSQIRSIGYFSSARPESGISEAVEFVQSLESPYVAFDDFNRQGFATLNELHNTLTGSTIRPDELLIHDRYIFFYGKLLKISGNFDHHDPRITLTFQVDTVKVGYPDWIVEGAELDIYWPVRETEVENPEFLFEVGSRYFLGAEYGALFFWRQNNIIRPLQALDAEPLLAIPVLPGEEVDFNILELSHLPAIMEVVDANQRAMRVLTSTDLTAKPQVQEQVSMWLLRDGRWINHRDYLEGNPVAVVHWAFADERGLSVGDAINLTLWDFSVRPPPTRELAPFSWGIRTTRGGIRNMQVSTTWEIEVEIVGTFVYQESGPLGPHSKDIWVPSSVVPEWFGADSHPTNLTYSFVLTCYLYQEAFEEAHGEELRGFGGGIFYKFVFLEHGGERFTDLVTPILQYLRRNVALFAVLFLLIALLIVFVYLRQRRRDLAILRALGCPKWRIIGQLLSPVILLWPPMIFLGGLFARDFAGQAAEETLAPLAEYGAFERSELILANVWLFFVGTLIFIFLFVMTLIGAFLAVRLPVLAMLQGEIAKHEKKKKNKRKAEIGKEKEMFEKISVSIPMLYSEDTASLPFVLANLPTTRGARQKAVRRNFGRRVRRMPAKSALALTLAFLSVFAMGWLRHAIEYNDSEIERLWNTTVVDGELFALTPDRSLVHYRMVHNILPSAVESILNTGFVDSIYLEMGYELAYLILPLPDGSFPYDVWEDWEYEDLFNPKRNRLFAVSDLEELVRDSMDYRDVFGRRNRFTIYIGCMPPYERLRIEQEPLEITYIHGFDPSVFKYGKMFDFEDVVPVILPQKLKDDLDLALGDTIFISHPFDRRIEAHPFIQTHPTDRNRYVWSLIRSWTITGEIVGSYTGLIHRPYAHDAIILPHGIVPSIRGALPGRYFGVVSAYNTLRFTVDVTRNRETAEFREELNYIVNHTRAGLEPLGFLLRDEELILIVSQLEQNLELLRMLYPIVLVTSLLVAIGSSLLLLFQNAKNAAVMRILGFSKRSTRRAFISEQLLLIFAGLLLGLGVLSFVGNRTSVDISTLLFAGSYVIAVFLGSLIGAISVSNRPPLELLQVRE